MGYIIMIEWLRSIFLGVVQGLTEFLPVSSSAHLNIMPWLFKWENISDSFDLALHAGTLFAILIYFYKDWLNLISGGIKIVVKKEKTQNGKIFWCIVAATIPAGILGLLLEKIIEKITDNDLNLLMIVIAVALMFMGVVLYFVDKKSKSKLKYDEIGFKQIFLVGLSQALAAAIPGTSRSGITMTVARGMGIERESAAKVSFMLSAPIVAAAVLLSMGDFDLSIEFFLGVIASFLSGLVVIKFLMDYLKRGGYKVFAIYRVVLGIIILSIALFRL